MDEKMLKKFRRELLWTRQKNYEETEKIYCS